MENNDIKSEEIDEHSKQLDDKDKFILYYTVRGKGQYTVKQLSEFTGISSSTINRRMNNPYLKVAIDRAIDEKIKRASELFAEHEGQAAKEAVRIMQKGSDDNRIKAIRIILNDYLNSVDIKHKGDITITFDKDDEEF